MLKKLLLVILAAMIGASTVSAQFSNAERKFMMTPHRLNLVGESITTSRVDGMPYLFGLPSLKDFVSKFRAGNDKSPNGITTVAVNTGKQTVLDYPSNSTPVQIWQDPLTPNNIHAVTMYNSNGLDGTRLTSYLFSSDRGTTWTVIGDVPSVRSGFSSIDGFSDGTALITTHTADPDVATTNTRSMAYKDAFAGLGWFTRLTPPGLNWYIWGRVMPTKDLYQTNKFIMISSKNGGGDSVFSTLCTDVSGTPGTWTNWVHRPNVNNAEKHSIARGTDGRIGVAYIDYTLADAWFMESTNNGSTFGTPTKIYTWTPTNHIYGTDTLFADYGPLTGISLAYKGNTPVVAFEGLLQTATGYYPGLEAKVFFWSPTTGVKVVADTNSVPFNPYTGITYNDGFMTHPSIGVSADGNAVFVSFFATSANVDFTDSTTQCDIWLFASNDGGATWPVKGKVNPQTPAKDWRYVSVSKWNDFTGTTFYANMIATRGNVAGVFNGGAPASLEDVYFLRSAVTFPNQPTTVTVPVSAGWNIVSVPVNAENMAITSLFPTAATNAYGFSNGYYTVSTAQTGKGYFIRFANSQNFNITGTLVTPKNIPVSTGWNIIGPFETDLNVSQITSNPPGIVATQYYGFSNGYVTSSILQKGKGYWVRVNQAGTLIIPGLMFTLTGNNESEFISTDWAAIEIKDASGNKTKLYIAKNMNEEQSYELPPIPPQGIFDARYETNTFVEQAGKNNTIRISSAQYPIQIKAEKLNGIKLKIKNKITGKIVNQDLSEGQVLTIKQPLELFDLISDNALPTTYNLEQNYPNPFNPETTIKYQIPEDNYVKIVIYDMLGREIRTLVDEKQNSGYYSIKFDASMISSGIYFYKLEVGNYTNVKKMVLLR